MTKFKYIYFFLLTTIFVSACRQTPSSISISNSNVFTTANTQREAGLVKFAYQNSQLEFKVPLSSPSLSQKNENHFSFTDIKKGVEVEYQVLSNGLKENIILNKIPSSNDFYTDINITNADIYLNDDQIFIFYDSTTNKYLYHFQAPYAIDAAGNRTDNVTYQLFQNNQPLTIPPKPNNQISVNFSNKLNKLGSGGNYSLKIVVDSAWLSDKNRVYPIKIDPTIITDTYSDTTKINTGSSTNYSVSGGQLTISSTGGCWSIGGTCDASCSYSGMGTAGFIDYYQTYFSPSNCGNYLTNTLPSAGCSEDGSGTCYLPGSTHAYCFLDIDMVYYPTDEIVDLGSQCSWIGYSTSANIFSTNLLSSINAFSISTFRYTLSSLPANTTAGVKFSQNGSTWVNSSGSVGATNPLTVGVTTPIDLSGLNWSGSNFYYQIIFTSDGNNTPALDDISLTYNETVYTQFEGLKMEGIKIN